jgi:hypothetical protein
MAQSIRARATALLDVAAVVAAFFAVKHGLTVWDFGSWQQALFGATPVSALLLFFAGPMLLAGLRNTPPETLGLSARGWGQQTLTALKAAAFLLPATFLFPLIARLGYRATDWEGAAILALGFLGAGLLYGAASAAASQRPAAQPASGLGPFLYAAIFVASAIAMQQLHPSFPLAARLIGVIVFVAFMEEIFFRGFMQSRLNDAFGKPFAIKGVTFGPALFVAALVFGLFHPISVAGDPPWPWALWTTAFGLVLGFLREKTGSIYAPGLVHGIILIPSALVGPSV